MKSQNIHDTIKWKKKRKNHLGALCSVPKCIVCHSGKVMNEPKRREMRSNSKLKENEI